MAKNHHKWHCGSCSCDLHVTRAKKGTKYLYCPHCQKQVAYFNKGILGIATKGILKAVPGVGTAISLAETATDIYKSVKGEPKAEASAPVVRSHRNIYTTEERVRDALR